MRSDRKNYKSPFLSLGGVAFLSGLDRDAVFMLTRKGVLQPVFNKDDKMLFERNDIFRWLRER